MPTETLATPTANRLICPHCGSRELKQLGRLVDRPAMVQATLVGVTCHHCGAASALEVPDRQAAKSIRRRAR